MLLPSCGENTAYEHSLPPRLVAILEGLHAHFKYLEQQIVELDREVAHQLADDDLGRRLLTIPRACYELSARPGTLEG